MSTSEPKKNANGETQSDDSECCVHCTLVIRDTHVVPLCSTAVYKPSDAATVDLERFEPSSLRGPR
jgi:hypothetical protein